MSALTFDKSELGNLEYSLQREMLATDRKGGYMSTTIVCCNTRKYHGLMVAPIDDSDETYVLLSSLDETIIQHNQSFNLALHRYKGVYEPRGHKYITDFEYTPTPTITYRVGGVILRKELLWIHKRTQLMIRYTLVDAHSDTTLRLRPFFAFRNKHSLSKANMDANGRSYPIPGGVKCRLYEGFPWLYLQTDKEDAEFVAAPDWYYNFEYPEEIKRGYDGYEDLLTTGYFEMNIKKGESVIFSAATDEMATSQTITEIYEASLARRTHKIDFLSCLHHSARQFIVRRSGGRTEMIAGYPWYGTVGRDTFIALPGVVLEQGYKEDCMDVLDTMVRGMHDGDFAGSASAWVAADAPLWFFWTLQNLEKHIGAKELWARYGEAMKAVLEAYRRGFGGRVVLHDNGLIWAAADGEALTWMNTKVDGHPVAQRAGYDVEIEALWYNAVCYTLALAAKMKDKEFVDRWADMPERTKASFEVLARGELSCRLCKRQRSERFPPLEHDRGVRSGLYDAQRGADSGCFGRCAPAPAHASRPAFTLAAQSPLRAVVCRRPAVSGSGQPQRLDLDLAPDVLRQELFRHRRRAISLFGRGDSCGLPRRDTDGLHRFGERVFRGRSSIPCARMPLAGDERRRSAIYKRSCRVVPQASRQTCCQDVQEFV